MAFGLWVNVATVLVGTPAIASRTQAGGLRQSSFTKDLDVAQLSKRASLSNHTTDMVMAKGLSSAAKDALHKVLADLARIGFGLKRGQADRKVTPCAFLPWVDRVSGRRTADGRRRRPCRQRGKNAVGPGGGSPPAKPVKGGVFCPPSQKPRPPRQNFSIFVDPRTSNFFT